VSLSAKSSRSTNQNAPFGRLSTTCCQVSKWFHALCHTRLCPMGIFEVKYTLTKTGSYPLIISHATGDVKSTTITVTAAAAAADFTTVAGLPPATPLRTCAPPLPDCPFASSFTLVLRDAYKNALPTGDDLTAVLADMTLTVATSIGGVANVDFTTTGAVDADTAEYITTVAFAPSAAGVIRLALSIGGTPIVDAVTLQAYQATVFPGIVAAPFSTYGGAGIINGAIAGIASKFVIRAADVSGGWLTQEIADPDDEFTVGPGRPCLPHHAPHCRPHFLDSIGRFGYSLGRMPIQSCGQSVSARRVKAGAWSNAHTELRPKRQRSAREAIYRNRPIGMT